MKAKTKKMSAWTSVCAAVIFSGAAGCSRPEEDILKSREAQRGAATQALEEDGSLTVFKDTVRGPVLSPDGTTTVTSKMEVNTDGNDGEHFCLTGTVRFKDMRTSKVKSVDVKPASCPGTLAL